MAETKHAIKVPDSGTLILFCHLKPPRALSGYSEDPAVGKYPSGLQTPETVYLNGGFYCLLSRVVI